MDVKEIRTITITKPDDWHLHLRDGKEMQDIIGFSSAQFGRALIMPNLKPKPITTVDEALDYRARILAALPKGSTFEPFMALALTDHTDYEEIRKAKKCPHILALKAYPASWKNNPATGITHYDNIREHLDVAEDVDMPVSFHGEAVDGIDIFDQTRTFIKTILPGILNDFPDLRIVIEHLSTADEVNFIERAGQNVVGTIAPHYLLKNRNNLLSVNGVNPDMYCAPVLKTGNDQWALLKAATSGNPKFFLGTDSAPHSMKSKYCPRGARGCFTAPHAIDHYAMAFERMGEISLLEGFASHFGARFYGLPRNTGKLTLASREQKVPEYYPFGDDFVVPFRGGEMVGWSVWKP